MRRKGSTSSSGGAGSGGLNDAEASLLDRNSKLKALVGFVMLSAGLLFSERFAHPQAPLPAAAPPQGQTAATPSASTSAALFAALPAALPAASETPAPVVGSLRAAGLSSPPQFGADVETVTLRSGIQMPAVGYGTCCRSTAKGKAVVESTIKYLKAGGKLIDTAMAYRNHKDIGKALRASGVAREAIWLTSKIAPSAVRSRTDTVAACHDILKDLGVEYLDLLLIHSPKLGRAKTTDLWKGLIDLQKDGKVRAIGVSNMNWGEINDLETATGVAPEVNQIQFHPWTPKPWRDLASRLQREKGIAVTAYTSLGGQRFRAAGSHWGKVLAGIASKHGVTEAQVLLRWARQQNVAVIPGSASERHIRENLLQGAAAARARQFVLTPEDIQAIEEAPSPRSWFDPARGPAKMSGEQAESPWAAAVRP